MHSNMKRTWFPETKRVFQRSTAMIPWVKFLFCLPLIPHPLHIKCICDLSIIYVCVQANAQLLQAFFLQKKIKALQLVFQNVPVFTIISNLQFYIIIVIYIVIYNRGKDWTYCFNTTVKLLVLKKVSQLSIWSQSAPKILIVVISLQMQR